jgi:hypothetical protein
MKLKKVLAATLAASLVLAPAVPTLAANLGDLATDSIASETEDGGDESNVGVADPTGKDVEWNKKSTYGTQADTTGNAGYDQNNVEVYATRANHVQYKIPQVLIASSAGTTNYKVSAKGTLASSKKIIVKMPKEFGITDTTDSYSYTAAQTLKQSAGQIVLGEEGDDLATGWNSGSITPELSADAKWVDNEVKFTVPELKAGNYTGHFNISVEVREASGANDTTLAAVPPVDNNHTQP